MSNPRYQWADELHTQLLVVEEEGSYKLLDGRSAEYHAILGSDAEIEPYETEDETAAYTPTKKSAASDDDGA